MGNIQQVKFHNINDFLEHLPAEELKLVKILRSTILSCLIDGDEKLAYNVPFYYRHSRICYIWPASVNWGGVSNGVAIGFCKGNLLRDEIKYLDKTDKKEIATKTFTEASEIDTDLLRAYIFEAIDLDELVFQAKKRKK